MASYHSSPERSPTRPRPHAHSRSPERSPERDFDPEFDRDLDPDFEEPENENVIVDFDIIEAAKENIQPLARGRSVRALASVLRTPHGRRDERLVAVKARLRERVEHARRVVEDVRGREKDKEKKEEDGGGQGEERMGGQDEDEEGQDEDGDEEDEEVEEDEDEDEDEDESLTLEEAEEILLDAYVRLVTWTIEHYPGGQSAESGILELLEEATRKMLGLTIAKGDARYLDLWLRYATYVDRPELIFEFLLTNEVGTMWGKLYERYASELEKAGRRSKADEIYMLGIARKAEPLEQLERRHREFQKRMMVAAPVLGSGETGGSNSTNSLTSMATSTSTLTASRGGIVESGPRRRKILGETFRAPGTGAGAGTGSGSGSGSEGGLALVSRDDVFSAPGPAQVLSPVMASGSGSSLVFGMSASASNSTTASTSTSTSTAFTSATSTSTPATTTSGSGLGSGSGSGSTGATHPRPNAKIPVYVDPVGSMGEGAPRSIWPVLETRGERIKENVRVVEKMQGAVLKQKGAARVATREAAVRARSGPRIVPFRDPVLGGGEEVGAGGGSEGSGENKENKESRENRESKEVVEAGGEIGEGEAGEDEGSREVPTKTKTRTRTRTKTEKATPKASTTMVEETVGVRTRSAAKRALKEASGSSLVVVAAATSTPTPTPTTSTSACEMVDIATATTADKTADITTKAIDTKTATTTITKTVAAAKGKTTKEKVGLGSGSGSGLGSRAKFTVFKEPQVPPPATAASSSKTKSLNTKSKPKPLGTKFVPFRDPEPEPELELEVESKMEVEEGDGEGEGKMEVEVESKIEVDGKVKEEVKKKGKNTNRFVPYRDPEPGLESAKGTKGIKEIKESRGSKGKERSHSHSNGGESSLLSSGTIGTAFKTPAKSGRFVPYVDPVGAATPAPAPAPATPRFVPYRDPVTSETPSTSQAGGVIGGSVMRLRERGVGGRVVSKESEALRKDPLKNYKGV